MEVLAIETPVLHAGDTFASTIAASGMLQDGDILVVSSKAVATCEGAAIDLATVHPSAEALEWSRKCGQTPEFRQAVLDETARMNGWVCGSCPEAMFTYLRPDGFPAGALLAANAGLDLSNIAAGHVVGWPKDPAASARQLTRDIRALSGKRVAVVIGDSCCMPGRMGVVAFALAVCGFDPLKDFRGGADLFGNTLRITQEAVADQLCIAANYVMGNAAQRTPAAVVRNHGLQFSDYCGWVPGIEPEEDLFRDMLWKKEEA